MPTVRDFYVQCDACRRQHGKGSWLGFVRDDRDLSPYSGTRVFDGLYFTPVKRAPGPVRAANPDATGIISGERVAVGVQLRAECGRRHRINRNRDEVLKLMAGALRVGTNVIYV